MVGLRTDLGRGRGSERGAPPCSLSWSSSMLPLLFRLRRVSGSRSSNQWADRLTCRTSLRLILAGYWLLEKVRSASSCFERCMSPNRLPWEDRVVAVGVAAVMLCTEKGDKFVLFKLLLWAERKEQEGGLWTSVQPGRTHQCLEAEACSRDGQVKLLDKCREKASQEEKIKR